MRDYHKKPSIVVLSFSDMVTAKFTKSRFITQAALSPWISSTLFKSELDFDDDFREEFGPILAGNIRGFGFWVWKPYLILQALTNSPEGAMILYIDAGCHLNPRGGRAVARWVDALQMSGSDIGVWRLRYSERNWSKQELGNYFGLTAASLEWDTRQFSASAILLRNSSITRTMVREWLGVFRSSLSFVDDSPSPVSGSQLVENRNDQSALSMILKTKYRDFTASFDISEQWPLSGDWRSLKRSPVLIKRDRFKRWGTARWLIRSVIR